MLFQLQECAALFMEQFDKLDFSMESKAYSVGFLLKEFQRSKVFASCDTVIYHQIGNTVSFYLLSKIPQALL